MKTNTITIGALMLALGFGISSTFAMPPQGQTHDPAATINALPYEDVSELEKEDMLWMVEEEKLARDVYLNLYDKWGERIFANIARSEQRHMDAVEALLNKYNIPNPVTDDARGVFQNKELKALYDKLMAQGNESVVEALKVGATIEDLDIMDLERTLKDTDNEDITKVYQDLERGSRNHLRAFTKALSARGETYTAQYISQEELEEIINTPHERGHGGNGNNHNCQHGSQGGGQGMDGGQMHQGMQRGMQRGMMHQYTGQYPQNMTPQRRSYRYAYMQNNQAQENTTLQVRRNLRGQGFGRGYGMMRRTNAPAINFNALPEELKQYFGNSRNLYHFLMQYFR